MSEEYPASNLLELTAEIVAAHASANRIEYTQIPDAIKQVYQALAALDGKGGNVASFGSASAKPAVPVKKSVTPGYIICLEDGKKLKMLKRYLKTNYNMSPAEYRARWNLPSDYPMTAPSYANKRSELAKKIGLGRKPGSKRGRKAA